MGETSEPLQMCPLKVAYAKIYMGGFEDDVDDTKIAKIGGHEYVCDDSSYYINMRIIELARFELQRPDEAACKEKLNKMFHRYVVGGTLMDVYKDIMDKSTIVRAIPGHFVDVCQSLCLIEEYIMLRVDMAKKAGQSINISIPDMSALTEPSDDMAYDPTRVKMMYDEVVSYMRSLDISALLGKNLEIPAHDVPIPLAPNLTMPLPKPTADIVQMHKLLDLEAEIAKYAGAVEKYNCKMIGCLNEVLESIKNTVMFIRRAPS